MPVAIGVRLPPLLIAVAVHRRDGPGLPVLADTALPVFAPRCGGGGRNVGDPIAEAVGVLVELMVFGAVRRFAGMPVLGAVGEPLILFRLMCGGADIQRTSVGARHCGAADLNFVA